MFALILALFLHIYHLTNKNHFFFNTFPQVKDIEKRDSVLTSDQQINRLLRKGKFCAGFHLTYFSKLHILFLF